MADPQRRASTSKTRRSPALPETRYTSRSGPRSVPLTTTGVDRTGSAVSMESLRFGGELGCDSSSVTSGNVPSVNSRMFEIPDGDSMRTG